jgi:hypothetical protein
MHAGAMKRIAARFPFEPSRLADGKVLIAGGEQISGGQLVVYAAAEVFTPGP